MKPEEKEKEQNMYKDVSPNTTGAKKDRMFLFALAQLSGVTLCAAVLSTQGLPLQPGWTGLRNGNLRSIFFGALNINKRNI